MVHGERSDFNNTQDVYGYEKIQEEKLKTKSTT